LETANSSDGPSFEPGLIYGDFFISLGNGRVAKVSTCHGLRTTDPASYKPVQDFPPMGFYADNKHAEDCNDITKGT
jgi:hypothetical protein